MNDLTGFQRDVLYVAAGLDEPYGLAIKDELDDYYRGDVNHGRLYPSLDKLVAFGLIDKERRDGRSYTYTLTRRGRWELEARREWENQYVGEIIDEGNALLEP